MTTRSLELERFRGVVERRFGLRYDDSRLGHLAEVLDRRLKATRESAGAYLGRLDQRFGAAEEARLLAVELTVSETYLFRNIEQFLALRDVALPARMAARAANRRLRMLSVGCASGDEAYSIAMLVRTLSELDAWAVSIQGIDISKAALAKAVAARYSTWSLRETPDDLKRRFLRPEGRDFVLDPAIRSMVTFLEQNLVEPDEAFWQSESLDVVFCRNMLMYLAPEAARTVVSRIARSLVPGGFLYLGHAETLRGLSRDFHIRHTHDTFYYQRKEEHETAGLVPVDGDDGRPLSEPAVPAADDGSWVESIRLASERVEALTQVPIAAIALANLGGVASATGGSGVRSGLVEAVELLRHERFNEAEATLDGVLEGAAKDPDVQLLRAALLVQRGDLPHAEGVCEGILEDDDTNASAHYVMALCREGAGALQSALEHDRVAIHLDSTFAMPHLHLGLLARRAGDMAGARQELESAIALLQREDPSRILLFGGGFGREALVGVCKAELARCESVA
jgi:chemotaxis protein methyltransferase CheR